MRKHCTLLAGATVLVVASSFTSGCSTPSTTMIAPKLVDDCAASFDAESTPQHLRMVTYNIHHGSESSLERIGDELETLDADVIALQEVDRFTERTERPDEDQAAILAERLQMDHVFAGAHVQDDGDFGIALLSRFPFQSVERVDLPGRATGFQPRVALDVKVCAGQTPVRVISTHVDVYPWVADQQAEFLAELAAKDVGNGVIVAGDMNMEPNADGIASLLGVGLRDPGPSDGTSSIEGRRIDYVLADAFLEAIESKIVDTDASDHVPVMTDLRLPSPQLARLPE